jgi:hypothetical protein
MAVPGGVWRTALTTRFPIAWRRCSWSPSTTTGSGASRVTGRPVSDATASVHAPAASTARSTGRRCTGASVEAGEGQEVLTRTSSGGLLLDAVREQVEVDVVLLGAEAEQLGEPLDGGEGRPQLVRGVGEELPEALLGRVSSSKASSMDPSMVLSEAELTDLGVVVRARRALGQVAGADGPGRGGLCSGGRRPARRMSHEPRMIVSSPSARRASMSTEDG